MTTGIRKISLLAVLALGFLACNQGTGVILLLRLGRFLPSRVRMEVDVIQLVDKEEVYMLSLRLRTILLTLK